MELSPIVWVCGLGNERVQADGVYRHLDHGYKDGDIDPSSVEQRRNVNDCLYVLLGRGESSTWALIIIIQVTINAFIYI